jgi:hypothetical protein
MHPALLLGLSMTFASPDSVFGVFEGRTPCGPIATEFTGFPSLNCEKIKWRLTLFRDPVTIRPTSFSFQGTRATRQGRWRSAADGVAGSNRVVYHLSYGSGATLSLLSVDDRLLLLLDRDGRVLVGDPTGSYTLSRVSGPPR